MRTHLLRTTSLLVPILLLGIAATRSPALAQQADPATDRAAIALPSPPPASVVIDGSDVTGSIGAQPDSAGPAPARAAETTAPVAANVAQAAPRPAESAMVQTTSAPTTLSDAAPDAGAAPVAPGAPGLPPAPAAVPAATHPGGLTLARILDALPGFVDEKQAGATRAESLERELVRSGVANFYAAHADKPLWVTDGHLNGAARAVMQRLDKAGEDALDLHGFAVPVPHEDDAASLVRTELALSEAVVEYGRQASGSRINFANIGGIIEARPTIAQADQILGSVSSAADPDEALRAFNPIQPGYVALRDKLAEMRARDGGAQAHGVIPMGRMLKTGMIDARVPLIRARFGLDVGSDDATANAMLYDTKVAAAVAGFQRANGLPPSGVLTSRTVAALSGKTPRRLEGSIVANMEEWRWMPRTFGADHIEVNIPEFKVRVFRDGQMMHEARVIVGQRDKPTPLFTQTMKFVIVNPYWNIPLSIVKKEMLPKLAGDPNYFADHGYEVVQRGGQMYVRQPPGENNALGRIKFMFPNDQAVYLHDTNAHSFFARDVRALSHGCVRVDQPFAFAEAVLGKQNGWTEARVKKLIGGKERTINLPEPLSISLMYFTTYVDPVAGLQVRDDVYGYTAKIEAALGVAG